MERRALQSEISTGLSIEELVTEKDGQCSVYIAYTSDMSKGVSSIPKDP